MTGVLDKLNKDPACPSRASAAAPAAAVVQDQTKPSAAKSDSEAAPGEVSARGEVVDEVASASGDVPTPQTIATVQSNADKERSQGVAKDAAGAMREVETNLSAFLNQHRDVCICLPSATGRVDVAAIASEAARDYVLRKVAALMPRLSTDENAPRKTPSSAAIDALLAVIRANARERNDTRKVNNRIAPGDGGAVLVDLSNPPGELARIDARGVTVEHQGDTLFQRGTGSGELPRPYPMALQDAWAVLRAALIDWGVHPDDHAVVIAVLCEWLRPGTPKPVLEIVGPAGASKTTTAAHLISIIDPMPDCGTPPTCKVTEPDLMAAFSQRYASFLDNVSRFSPDEQDLLCKVATGGAISTRRYYTQGEIFVVSLLAAVIITGINSVINRSDLLSRTETITLSARTGGYRSATEVRADFKQAHSALFSAVCALLSAGLAGLPAVKHQRTFTHRLVDFEQLGEAIFQALGEAPGWFGGLLATRRKTQAQDVADGDKALAAVLDAVRKAVASPVKIVPAARVWAADAGPGVVAWTDSAGVVRVLVTMSKLLRAVHSATFNELAGASDRAPRTEKALRHFLQHRQPTLRELGWAVDFKKVNDRSAAEFAPC